MLKAHIRIPALSVRDTRMTEKDGTTPVREQLMLLVIEGAFAPLTFACRLNKGQQPHAVGEYAIAPDSFRAGKYDGVDFRPHPGEPLRALSAVRPTGS